MKQKPLEESHFMPRALYDYCKSEDYDPIRVGVDFAMITGRQIKDRLLCRNCETILDRGGENWSVKKFATMDRQSFPLYELIRRTAPVFEDGDVSAYYGAQIPGLEVDKMVHFATGLFWKAAVHGWSKNKTEPRIKLGPYTDQLRRYLLGESPYPDYVKLWVNVTPPERANISFVEPYEGNSEDGFKTYFCYVLGLLLSLNVGKMVTEELTLGCFATNPNHPIFISNAVHDNLEGHMRQKYFRVRKARSILEMKERRVVQMTNSSQSRQD